ncbi:SDR family NAD(P)-dependent oxidoreductase [Planctomicrobium sp.]|nr:SDR family NAD(P)-dependent oxidoreductase [Planctomicrobium sp.]
MLALRACMGVYSHAVAYENCTINIGDGIVIVVTGASSGIGHAVAAALAQRGLPVLAVARSQKPLRELVDRFPTLIRAVAADLSRQDGIESVLAAVEPNVAVYGIVHSAGSRVTPESYQSINTEALIEHFRIHVASQIRLYQTMTTKVSIARMLFIDSYSASQPRDGWGAYSITKSASQMAARCAAQELSDTITIRVLPGAVRTGVVESVIASGTKTADVFQDLDKAGKVVAPEAVADFITGILVNTTDEMLRSIQAWDYNNLEHRTLVQSAKDRVNHSSQ